LFQLLEACGDVGLHVMQLFRRTGDAAGFGDGEENLQRGDVHGF
jgi:hypothetical protein